MPADPVKDESHVSLAPVFTTLMEILKEIRMAQLATVDQQREFARYMRGLNEWLERDVHDRQAELRGVVARVDQLRDDIRSIPPQGVLASPGSRSSSSSSEMSPHANPTPRLRGQHPLPAESRQHPTDTAALSISGPQLAIVNPWSKTSSLHRWGRVSSLTTSLAVPSTVVNAVQNVETFKNASVYGSPRRQPPADPGNSPASGTSFVTVNPWSESSPVRRRQWTRTSHPTTPPSTFTVGAEGGTSAAASASSRMPRRRVRFEGAQSEPPLSAPQSVESTGISLGHLPKPATASTTSQSILSLSPQNVAFFVLETAPMHLYLYFLLCIPLLYRSRVARICGEAELSLPDIKQMARTRADEWKLKENVEPQWDPGSRARGSSFMSHWSLMSSQDRTAVPRNLLKFRSSWESFIDSLMQEWQTLNIISALLLSAILTMLQIDAAANPITRTSALFSLISGIMSLLYGCLYIIRFGTMRKMHKASTFAMEANQDTMGRWWNIWVLLAMPAIWLSWSIIMFLVCIMSFVWLSGSVQDVEDPLVSTRDALGPRVGLTSIFALGLIYFVLIVKTFHRYGDPMDEQWLKNLQEWAKEETYSECPSGMQPMGMPGKPGAPGPSWAPPHATWLGGQMHESPASGIAFGHTPPGMVPWTGPSPLAASWATPPARPWFDGPVFQSPGMVPWTGPSPLAASWATPPAGPWFGAPMFQSPASGITSGHNTPGPPMARPLSERPRGWHPTRTSWTVPPRTPWTVPPPPRDIPTPVIPPDDEIAAALAGWRVSVSPTPSSDTRDSSQPLGAVEATERTPMAEDETRIQNTRVGVGLMEPEQTMPFESTAHADLEAATHSATPNRTSTATPQQNVNQRSTASSASSGYSAENTPHNSNDSNGANSVEISLDNSLGPELDRSPPPMPMEATIPRLLRLPVVQQQHVPMPPPPGTLPASHTVPASSVRLPIQMQPQFDGVHTRLERRETPTGPNPQYSSWATQPQTTGSYPIYASTPYIAAGSTHLLPYNTPLVSMPQYFPGSVPPQIQPQLDGEHAGPERRETPTGPNPQYLLWETQSQTAESYPIYPHTPYTAAAGTSFLPYDTPPAGMPQYFPGTTILRGSLDASSTPAAFNLRDLRINANDAGNVSPEITAYPSIVEDPGASGSSSSSGSSLGLDLITANNTIANANYGRAAVP